MHKKSNKANFSDIQRSPIIVELERQIFALQEKKRRLNKRLQQRKTNLEKLKKEIIEMQNLLSLKVSDIMSNMEVLRKEIVYLCKKVAKSKKISKSERRDIQEFEREFAGQRFFPDDMEEFLRERNKDRQEERGFKLFDKFNVAPKELEKRDIRKIYLRLADRFHPDRSRTEEQEQHLHELMQSINEAYDSYDVETLLRIQAEYCDSDVSNCADIGGIRNEPDYKEKLEAPVKCIPPIRILQNLLKKTPFPLKREIKSLTNFVIYVVI